MHNPSQQRLPLASTGEEARQNGTVLHFKALRGDQWYTISVDDKTCDCIEFYERAGRCEHLDALGIHRLRPFTPTSHPTFSQALSGLVKSIRLRRVEDAAYWLLYLDTFVEPQCRFRTARRLLIALQKMGTPSQLWKRLRTLSRI